MRLKAQVSPAKWGQFCLEIERIVTLPDEGMLRLDGEEGRNRIKECNCGGQGSGLNRQGGIDLGTNLVSQHRPLAPRTLGPLGNAPVLKESGSVDSRPLNVNMY